MALKLSAKALFASSYENRRSVGVKICQMMAKIVKISGRHRESSGAERWRGGV